MRAAPAFLRIPLASLALPARKRVVALSIAFLASIPGVLLAPPELALAGVVLAFGLTWAATIDADRFILPDLLTLGLVVIGLAFAMADGVAAAQPYIFGAIAGYLALASIAWAYRRMRKRNGLGLGDAKLLAAAGAWLGWAALPFVVLISAVVCLIWLAAIAIWRRRQVSGEPIPFGPFLSGAIWIVWLFQLGGRA